MAKGKRKLKKPQPERGRLKATSDDTTSSQLDYPVFCFKYLGGDYGLESCDQQHCALLIKQLNMLSKKRWQEIDSLPRHGLGYEKISQDKIKVGMPGVVTGDVRLYAFRFHGKKPFVGFRNREIFHILFVDHNFTLYDHGS